MQQKVYWIKDCYHAVNLKDKDKYKVKQPIKGNRKEKLNLKKPKKKNIKNSSTKE